MARATSSLSIPSDLGIACFQIILYREEVEEGVKDGRGFMHYRDPDIKFQLWPNDFRLSSCFKSCIRSSCL